MPSKLAAVLLAASAALAAEPTTSAPADGPALKTGDLVVFVGDELTEMAVARRTVTLVYPLLVETFLTARYPELCVRYVNAGWSGDTVTRVALRLDRDVLAHKPTVVVICLGLNDPGYLGFAPDRLESFKEDLTRLVRRCGEAGARTWLISPPSVEEEKGRKLRVMRDGRPAVADLQAIHYDATLARYAAAVKEVAAATGSGFVDWFERSRNARHKVNRLRRGGLAALTRDGRLPQLRSTTLAAAALLRAWRVQPIRVTIDLHWQEGTAQVAARPGQTASLPMEITEGGKRILEVHGLPLPWPMPGGQVGAIQPDWQAATMCEFVFRMADPPELGIVLTQETSQGEATGQSAILASQLRAGFNLATTEPLRSVKGVADLFKLIATRNNTQHTVWRRLELSAPREPELAAAHKQLIAAWQSYVAGYEEMISKYPKTFDARLVLTEAVKPEHLPTSRPVRTRPARHIPGRRGTGNDDARP